MVRLEYMPVEELKPARRNPKRHAPGALAASIDRFGYVEPIVVDERTGLLVAGHGRRETLLAMRKSGQQAPSGITDEGGAWLVPVVRGWASRSDREADACLIASNRHVELGGWDEVALGKLLKEIGELAGIGYSQEDLDKLLASNPPPFLDETLDQVPVVEEVWVNQGDLFELGRHRLLCGDCRDAADIDRLIKSPIAVAVTSPPYASQRAYDSTSGFQPIAPEGYCEWFGAVQSSIARHLAPDGSFFLNLKEHAEDGERSLYVKDLVLAMKRRWGWRFVDELCWRNSRDGVPGGWPNRFKNAWEPIFHFSRAAKIKFHPERVTHASEFTFEYSPKNTKAKSGSGLLGQDRAHGFAAGKARPSNVIELPSETGQGDHTAPFPVKLPAFFLAAFSDPADSVFDPFLGSGTTLIAAEVTGRAAVGMEISPRYAQVAIERWQKLTSQKARKV
jgi:site-specific DNA-methyltransferase (adenine-specific)/site-specific DNA-methyltransferase (cytosine-N4-specific)